MSSEIIAAALKERTRLREDFVRLQKQLSSVEAVLSSYGYSELRPLPVTSPALGAFSSSERSNKRVSKRDLISQYAKEAISIKGGHARMSEILAYLEDKKILLKTNTLSAYLSTDPDLVADRKKGWGLKLAQTNTASAGAEAVDVVHSEQHPVTHDEKGGSHGL